MRRLKIKFELEFMEIEWMLKLRVIVHSVFFSRRYHFSFSFFRPVIENVSARLAVFFPPDYVSVNK